MFAELLDFFRTPEGTGLLLWTITDEKAAQQIANTAWSIGRDSLLDFETKGIYKFNGLEKSKYPKVADDTTKNLTGDGLEVFGLTGLVNRFCKTVAPFLIIMES